MNELKILKELTVLYVDDDIKACESLQLILNYYFKTVLIAHNGEEALSVYDKNQCHFLIVDYDMPIMDGYKFLSKVRESNSNIFAIIMSSYDDKVKLKKAIKLNLLEYITKPYELKDLKGILSILAKEVDKKSMLKYHISEACYYDMSKKVIINNESTYKLTSFEVKIFEHLLNNENQIIRYDTLLDILESTNQKSLISMIYKINKKLPHKLIENVKDFGYKMIR